MTQHGAVPERCASSGLSHTASLAGLDEAVASHSGVLLVTGEPRTGKTALVTTFTRRMERDGMQVEILRAVDAAPLDVSYAVRELTWRVRECATARSRALVVIDDAHVLPRAVLEQIDALFVPDRAAGALVHVLLAGRPGLATTLAGTALAERVTAHCHLPPLTAHEWTEPDDRDQHQPSRWWRFPGADLAGAVLGAIAFLAVALGIVAYGTPPVAPQTAAPKALQERTSAHAASPESEPEPLSLADDQVVAVELQGTLSPREVVREPERVEPPVAREPVAAQRTVRAERPNRPARPELPRRSTSMRTSISETGGGAPSGGRRLQLPPRRLELPTARRESPASTPPPASPPRRPPRLDEAHDPAAVIDWLVNHAAVARGNAPR
jgi:hypothetical protein